MTPEQLEALRASLPAIFAGAPDAVLLDAYRDYYSLDFSAQFPDLQYHLGHVASGQYQLATHLWLREGATANLLLLHGYFDHSGIFGKLVQWALAHQCNVLMFDLPGHGLSTGEPAVIDSFGEYARSIDDVMSTVELPDLPLWTMGQSTGCAALIEYARILGHKRAWPFVATVMLAPLIRPVGWHGIRAAHRVVRPFRDTVTRTFNVNTSDEEFLKFLQQEPLQSRYTSLRWITALENWLGSLDFSDLGVGPVLVVQGDQDGTVDWRYNWLKLLSLFPDSRFECITGAGHQLANESESLRANYLARVRQYLRDCALPLGQSSG